jgi:hypothetical protein
MNLRNTLIYSILGFVAAFGYIPVLQGTDLVVKQAAHQLVQGLANQLRIGQLRVTLGSLTLENTNISSEFSNVFLNEVENVFKGSVAEVVEVIKKRGTTGTRGLTRSLRGFSDFDETENNSNWIVPVYFEGHYR